MCAWKIFYFLFLVVFFYLVLIKNTFAIQINAIPAIGVEYSDNIDKLPDNEKQNAWSYLGKLAINVEEHSPIFKVDVDSLLEYQNYSDGLSSDEKSVNLDGSVIWELRPRTLQWLVRDYATQTETNPLGNDTSSNRENVNAFSTGPDLQFHLGRTRSLGLGARYTRFDYQKSENANSIQPSVFARLVFAKSSTATLSILTSYTQVNFEDDNDSDFNRQDGIFSFKSIQGGSEFTVDLGGSFIDRRATGNIKRPLGRLKYSYDTPQDQHFELSITSQFNDFGNELLARSESINRTADLESISPDSSDVQASTDIFLVKRGEINYQTKWTRTRAGLSGLWADEDYEEQVELDNALYRVRGNITYALSPILNGTFIGEYTYTDYPTIDQEDKEYTLEAQLSYRLRRNLSLAISMRRDGNDSTDPTISFKENSIFLTLEYNRSGS